MTSRSRRLPRTHRTPGAAPPPSAPGGTDRGCGGSPARGRGARGRTWVHAPRTLAMGGEPAEFCALSSRVCEAANQWRPPAACWIEIGLECVSLQRGEGDGVYLAVDWNGKGRGALALLQQADASLRASWSGQGASAARACRIAPGRALPLGDQAPPRLAQPLAPRAHAAGKGSQR